MAGLAQTQVSLVQVRAEFGQVLVLSADVCGQDQGAQLPLHVKADESNTERMDYNHINASSKLT